MPAGRARVGITVSSKVGGAVVRNRVKRKIREAIRQELGTLPAVDLVLVARASAVDASVADFCRWLRRATRRIEGGGAP
jgi:ribonuclease P protein component